MHPTAGAAASDTVPGQPWRAYNYAPSSRTLAPVAVHTSSGTVTNPGNVLSGQPTQLSGSGSSVTLDFGKEVGGIVTLRFAGASDANQQVGLAFTESSQYIGPNSDASNGGGGADGAIYAPVTGAGSWTMPADKLRGGFRYLTLFLNSAGWVDLNGVSLAFTAAPGMANPQDYPDYFYSSDPLLNRIWYAGAYTVQMDTIRPDQGRVWGPPASGWENNAVVGVGDSVLVDGAKRDRTVWPGDMGIAVPTAFVSTNDMVSTRNSLTTLYQHQDRTTGQFPFAGPQVNFYGSDTYHMWTLVGTAAYYQYTGDRTWLDPMWTQYKAGVAFVTNKIDARGLLNVTGAFDWARSDQGGENIEANAILYRVLTSGSALARDEGDAPLADHYDQLAAALKSAANAYLWDAAAGAYRDNPTSTLYPQDGNSLAVWYGLTDSPAKALSISQALTRNWNSFGAQTPEKGNAIGTFPGSMEVQAHFAANDDQTGLDLIRREWGYMLNSPLGTGSTFWEGYQNDGSFDYGGAYMSNAHGWATGPTSALTFDVLGIAPDSAGGRTYHLVPHPGDLTHAEGRLTTPAGALTASWTRDLQTQSFQETLNAPDGTTGGVAVPTFGRPISVSVNGRLVWDGRSAFGYGAHTDGRYVYLEGVAGGTHTVTSHPAGPPVRALSVTASTAQATVKVGAPTTVSVTVTGQSPDVLHGTLTVDAPSGWSISPAQIPFTLDGRYGPASTSVTVQVTPPSSQSSGPYTLDVKAAASGMTANSKVAVLVFGRWPTGTTVTATSFHAPNVFQGQQRTYDPANAIDGNLVTFWNDNTPWGYPDVLTITSPTPVTMSGVAFASIVDGVPIDFTVETWNGSAWVQQARVTGNDALTRWIPFPGAVTTTQVRLTVTKDQPQNAEFTRVAELAP